MHTEFVSVDSVHPDIRILAQAADVLRRGGLVAFPTETVYGLGANGLDPHAVAGIFAAKGRPADNPLILHIADCREVAKLARHVPANARVLMETYWPDPLTLVLERTKAVPDAVTGGAGHGRYPSAGLGGSPGAHPARRGAAGSSQRQYLRAAQPDHSPGRTGRPGREDRHGDRRRFV